MADGTWRFPEVALASVPTPPTGKLFIFVDAADKHFKSKDDLGAIVDLTAGGEAADPYSPRILNTTPKTAAFTAVIGEAHLIDLSGGNFTANLPVVAGEQGKISFIIEMTGGQLTIDGSGSETIGGKLTLKVSVGTTTIENDGTEWQITQRTGKNPNRLDPAQITADQDPYNPADWDSTITHLYVNSDASRNLDGFEEDAFIDMDEVRVVNDGSFDLVIRHNTSTVAANRVLVDGGEDFTLAPGKVALLIRDGGVNRWRLYALNVPGRAWPPGFLRAARLAFATAAQVTIGTASVTSSVRDSADSFNIEWTTALTADITLAGAGGLDTGSEAAGTWYAVHVIADSSGVNPVDALLSLSATAPTLPTGYDKFRRLGWVRNDASSDFLRFSQTQAGNDRTYMYDIPLAGDIEVLSNGSAIVFTAVDLSVAVPPTSRWSFLRLDFLPISSSQDFAIRPSDFVNADRTTAPFLWQAGVDLSTEARMVFWVECDDNQSIDYIQSSASNTLDIVIVGFRDEI